eukprot:gene6711-7804_t
MSTLIEEDVKKQEREDKERLKREEKERLKREEREKIERDKLEKERLKREEKERVEREKLERLEREKAEKDRTKALRGQKPSRSSSKLNFEVSSPPIPSSPLATAVSANDDDVAIATATDDILGEDHEEGTASPPLVLEPGTSSSSSSSPSTHLQSGKRDNVVIKVTRTFAPVAHQNVLEEEGENKMRNKVINEVINTEKDYISDLKVIINILNDKDQSIIFSNVAMLLSVNEVLLTDLEKTAKENGGSSIGPCFKYLADYLKIYSSYCSNQQLSHDHLLQCIKKNPQFKQYLDEKQTLPECRQGHLDSFLIKPIQRLCKYPLLLRELIKNSPEGHPDIPSLEEAYSKIQTAVITVNENKRKAEVQQKMYKIHEQLETTEKFDFLTPTRYLIREDTLKELTEEKDKVAGKSHYYLFNDIIMRTKKDKKSIKLETLFLIASTTINGCENRTSTFCNTFELTQMGSAGRKFTLVCDTYEQKMEWMTDIEQLIKPYQEESMREYEKLLDEPTILPPVVTAAPAATNIGAKHPFIVKPKPPTMAPRKSITSSSSPSLPVSTTITPTIPTTIPTDQHISPRPAGPFKNAPSRTSVESSPEAITTTTPPPTQSPPIQPTSSTGKARPLPAPGSFTNKIAPRPAPSPSPSPLISSPPPTQAPPPVPTSAPPRVEPRTPVSPPVSLDDSDVVTPPSRPPMAFPKSAGMMKQMAPTTTKSYSTFTPSSRPSMTTPPVAPRSMDDLATTSKTRPPVLPPTTSSKMAPSVVPRVMPTTTDPSSPKPLPFVPPTTPSTPPLSRPVPPPRK